MTAEPDLTGHTGFNDFDVVFFNEDVDQTPTSCSVTPLSTSEGLSHVQCSCVNVARAMFVC